MLVPKDPQKVCLTNTEAQLVVSEGGLTSSQSSAPLELHSGDSVLHIACLNGTLTFGA